MKIVLITVLLLSLSCIDNKNNKNNKENMNILKKELITVKEAKEIISENNKNFILLDIRTKKEYDDFHIKGAINIDYYNPNFKKELEKLDKNNEYLIYCRTAHRTIDGLKIMKELNFKVSHLKGGITNWIHQNEKVVKN